MQSVGPLHLTISGPASPVTTALLLHGIGLGGWLWDPWLPGLHAAGIRTAVAELPGHHPEGAPDMDVNAAADAVVATIHARGGDVSLIGHSLGGLLALLAASRADVRAVALVCPLLPGRPRRLPARPVLREAPRVLARYVTGRPLVIRPCTYRKLGFSELDDATAAASLPRIQPWPPKLTRSLLIPPDVAPGAVRAPIAVFIGKRDPVVFWHDARVLGDLHEALVWRYDDVGHTPPLEPHGARVARDLTGFLLEPGRPKIIEFEAFGPGEGVGTDVRVQRRGDARKKRSAYGQKESARKD